MANRKVGTVTGVTTVGGGLGAALAQILVHFVPRLEEVESAVTVVLTVLLALVSGYLVPPQHQDALNVDYDPDEEDDEDIDADLGLEAYEDEDALQ